MLEPGERFLYIIIPIILLGSVVFGLLLGAWGLFA